MRSNEFGGAERDRTVGLLNAIEALSQLSYSPSAVLRRHAIPSSDGPSGQLADDESRGRTVDRERDAGGTG